MSTTVAPEATPQDGSLEAAASAFSSLLSPKTTPTATPSDTEGAANRQPEQSESPKPKRTRAPKAQATPIEQAPAAPVEENSPPEGEQAKDETNGAEREEAPSTENAADSIDPESLHTVTLPGGKKGQVTYDELLRGYSRMEDYTQKRQADSDARKRWESTEVAEVRKEREQYRGTLVQLEQALQDMTPTEPDWNALRQQLTPEQFSAEVIGWQTNQKRLEAVRAERARVEGQQLEDAKTQLKQYVETERTKLIEADPDFGDPTKNQQLNDDLCQFAISKGFTAQEVSQTVDHRLVLVLRDAMRYQQLKAKQPAVRQKLESVITTATPGGSRANQPTLSKAEQALRRLKETGSVDDAAAAFAARLG